MASGGGEARVRAGDEESEIRIPPLVGIRRIQKMGLSLLDRYCSDSSWEHCIGIDTLV